MKKKHLLLIRDYCYISFACVLMGFAINYFYISNKLAEGGVAGITLILHYLSDISASYLYLTINLPLLLISWKFLGKDFSLKTIYGTFVLSFFIEFFSYLRTPIPDCLEELWSELVWALFSYRAVQAEEQILSPN